MFTGYYTGQDSAAVSSSPCPAGSFSHEGQVFCDCCGYGYYSVDGASECDQVPPGFFTDVEACAFALTACPMGSYSNGGAVYSCADVPAGNFLSIIVTRDD